MTVKGRQDFVNRCMAAAPNFFRVALIFCIIFLYVGSWVMPDESDQTATECKEFEADWYHVMDNGEMSAVEVPGKVPAQWGEVVTLTTTLPQELENGENICFRPIWQDISVYIDGKLRVHYDTKDSRPFGTNSAFRYVFVELHEEDEGKELTYQFSSNSKYAGTIKKMYIGDRASIWFYLVEESAARASVALCLLLLGVFCVIVCWIMGLAYKRPLELRYLAWAISLCAFWMLSEVEFRQLLVDNISVMTNSTYWSLMLITFPLILYMNEIQKGYYKKLYVITAVYSMIVFTVGTILQIFDVMQFVEQLPFIHAGFILALVSIICTITIDLFQKRIKDYMIVGIGIYGLLFSAILEIVLYYLQVDLSLGTVLGIGLMFLLVMAIIKTGQDLLQAEKKKQQAIMAKEAQAKFLANMSHEIRTPINAVIGMNEMILRENEDETVREYAQNIQSASHMLLELVNDILDFSKIESGQLELVEDTYNVVSLIQNEKLLLDARVAGKPISTQIIVDKELPSEFFGDELRIKQVLTNIISNAVKYTKQGTVTLKVYFQWLNEERVSLCFSIIDTGVGIKKEDLPHLFDKFKRLDLGKNRNVEGTGLGLNIAKQLVEQMQGTLVVESEYGKGSTFTVSIPQKVMDKSVVGNFEDALRECRNGNHEAEILFTAKEASVLVVDDNQMNLNLMKSLLKRTKIQVDLAKSGRECLEFTRQKRYHVILMDHMMPELDGVETLHILREEQTNLNKDTIVIALTANAIAGCREMYLEYGFDDYLSKPIQANKLDQLLVSILPADLVYYVDTGVQDMLVKPEKEDASGLADSSTKAAGQISKDVVQEKLSEQEENMENSNQDMNAKEIADVLAIDRELGLLYCLNMEDIYQEALKDFCEQAEEYIPKFEEYFNKKDWKQYAVIAHGLKGNAKNIGASAFAEISFKHEEAAKENNEAFILKDYHSFMELLQKLIEKIRE